MPPVSTGTQSAVVLSRLNAAIAAPADDAVSPDRPSATNGPDVVGRGVVRIETGPAAAQRTKGKGTQPEIDLPLSGD